MTFKGNGIIWNPAKNKPLVNFNNVDDFETDDPKEIEILIACPQVYSEQALPNIENDEPIKLGKKDIIEILKERDIDFNPRDKKELLESLLYEE